MAEQYVNGAQTTLNGDITDASTTIVVANSSEFPTGGNFRVRIDNEILKVTAVSGNSWTVVRAAEEFRGVQQARAHIDRSHVTFCLTVDSLGTLGGGGGVSFDSGNNLFIGGGGTSIVIHIGPNTGLDNLGIGVAAIDESSPVVSLAAITTGTGNVAIGNASLGAVTSGYYNQGHGDRSLGGVTTGFFNVAYGNSTGTVNARPGAAADLTTGNSNTFIGSESCTSKADLVNSIALGANALVRGDNQCVIGSHATDSGTPVCIIFAGSTAPADADLIASQGSLYWDFTNGAPALKVKLKTADGTVVSKTITWS